MNKQIKKIEVTEALKKGLFSILHYGSSGDKYNIADQAIIDYPHLDRVELIECIEDAFEFIRQIAVQNDRSDSNPLEEVK
jgi:hypothetical protein